MQNSNDSYKGIQPDGLYLLELMRAALLGTKAQEKPQNISWEDVYKLAKAHGVEGLSAFGVKTVTEKPPQDIWKIWQYDPQRVTYRILCYDVERERILLRMKEAGLSYLPLKGIHILNYYPEPGMRSMADNDILFGYVEQEGTGYRLRGASQKEQEKAMEEASEVLLGIMEEYGYSGKICQVHDKYVKTPFFAYEMHKQLFYAGSPFYQYYENPWKRAVADEQDSNSFHFTDEDEFIYMMVHAYKHFSNGGYGIRLLADIYVFLEKKGAQMNWEYVLCEFGKLQLQDFAETMKNTAKALFGEPKRRLSEEEQELLQYMLSSGTYGSVQNYVWNQLIKSAGSRDAVSLKDKVSYIWRRLFPDITWWQTYYPELKGKKYRYVFAAWHRIGKRLISKSERMRKEWNAVWKRNRK